MYQPSHFQEQRIPVMHDLMRGHPFATLISNGSDGLSADHIPLLVHDDGSEHGVLRGHVAKANPLTKHIDQSQDVLAAFQGPHHYITPAWYPSKKEHGKVVPTWNYAIVHAHGPIRFIDDADWLLDQVTALTYQQEGGRDQPWAVSDAPEDYTETMLKAIIGLEIQINRLHGKWKVSQNRPEADRKGVVQGLKDEETTSALLLADLTSD
ncbi:MAG: FMN-binding negative transcriptional regulator [Rhodospirillaceae bacterium]|nr:FMN-binding negative transcriptional regulator [Rhodospirillaceae bacterium]MBL6941565.1 FMN-binding negative transcriptional regulator [Rhodospirillales bacterium]